jgi:hypothetical protein
LSLGFWVFRVSVDFFFSPPFWRRHALDFYKARAQRKARSHLAHRI